MIFVVVVVVIAAVVVSLLRFQNPSQPLNEKFLNRLDIDRNPGASYATSFEARFQQMESLCHRLEGLSGQLAHSIDALNRDSSSAASHDRAAEDPHHATRAPSAPYSRQRTPLPGLSSIAQTNAGPGMVPSGSHVRSVKLPKPVHLKPNNWSQSSDLSDSESSDDDGDSNLTDVAVRDTTLASNRTEPENHVGALVRDSYGRPR